MPALSAPLLSLQRPATVIALIYPALVAEEAWRCRGAPFLCATVTFQYEHYPITVAVFFSLAPLELAAGRAQSNDLALFLLQGYPTSLKWPEGGFSYRQQYYNCTLSAL